MRYRLLSFTLIILYNACAQPKSSQQWLMENTHELSDGSGYDFSSIGNAIADKRIVALGESSHGLGKFYELKSALVKYLHEKKGFEVIAMEGSLGDINLAYVAIDSLKPQELRDNTVFGNFRAQEANALFEYIKNSQKTDRPLIYTGYDSQSSSGYLNGELKNYLKPHDPILSASLEAGFASYYGMIQMARQEDSLGYYRERNKFQETALSALNAFKTYEDEIMDEFDLNTFQATIIKRTLNTYHKSLDLPYDLWWKGSELRDKLMAENLIWLAEKVFKGKKIIIWAHNAHIENRGVVGSSIKWMGHYLKEKYQDDYYALGLFAYKGRTYKHWTRTYENFELSDSTFIEKKLMDTKTDVAFLNLAGVDNTTQTQWLFDPVHGYEVENGGKVEFIPAKRFDGILSVYESKAPTYE